MPVHEFRLARRLVMARTRQASAWIFQCVDRPDPRPVWVVIWGGSADLAQALWRVRQDRKPEELSRFMSSSVSTPSAIRTRRVRGSESSSQDCS